MIQHSQDGPLPSAKNCLFFCAKLQKAWHYSPPSAVCVCLRAVPSKHTHKLYKHTLTAIGKEVTAEKWLQAKIRGTRSTTQRRRRNAPTHRGRLTGNQQDTDVCVSGCEDRLRKVQRQELFLLFYTHFTHTKHPALQS